MKTCSMRFLDSAWRSSKSHELQKELDSIRIGFVRKKEPVAGAPDITFARSRSSEAG